jgi:ferredoxin
MKVHIDREGCIGCGVCEALCPAVFKLDENVKSSIVQQYRKSEFGDGEVGEDMVSCVETARDSCPVSVIATE